MIAALLAFTSAVAQQSVQTDYQSFVSVTGRCEKELVPDRIYIAITIDESATNGKLTVEKLQKEMIASLKKLGIDVEKNLQVGAMSSDLETYIFKKDKVQTSKSFVLEVNSAQMVGNVFEALAKLNITNMSITKATRSDLDEIKAQMRVEAMQNAKQIASTLAEAVGQTIGKAFYVVDNNYTDGSTNYYGNVMLMRSAKVDEMTTESQPELEFQNLKLAYSVSVKFVLN